MEGEEVAGIDEVYLFEVSPCTSFASTIEKTWATIAVHDMIWYDMIWYDVYDGYDVHDVYDGYDVHDVHDVYIVCDMTWRAVQQQQEEEELK